MYDLDFPLFMLVGGVPILFVVSVVFYRMSGPLHTTHANTMLGSQKTNRLLRRAIKCIGAVCLIIVALDVIGLVLAFDRHDWGHVLRSLAGAMGFGLFGAVAFFGVKATSS